MNKNDQPVEREKKLDRSLPGSQANGLVYLVGAGPGNPGLLTLRGAALIKRAEVLVYDYLASPQFLSMAPPHCRLIYVGKMSGCHAKSQEEINQILIDEAKAGRVVVRLKGGDPYIFGRGGEEGQELARAGVVFEVVPGISSTFAAAAYAGIPLTHRDLSSQAVLATGHEKSKEESAHDWPSLAKMGTISMVMGVRNLDYICQKLIEAGRSPSTPAALVQWGTTTRQRTLVGTLADLASLAEAAQIGPPALFVAGEVVNLRPELSWFEKLPLFGRKILVTRSREQASRLSEALEELGAEVWERPTIAIEPLFDEADLNTIHEAPSVQTRTNPGQLSIATNLASVLANLADYDWVIFTSPNGAQIFLQSLWATNRDCRALSRAKIAVVGPGTAAAMKPFGLKPDLVPQEYVAESLLAALTEVGVTGKKILLARGLEGRQILPEGLTRAGAQVTEIPLYKTTNPSWAEPLPQTPDLVTFTSSSTAAGLAALIPLEERKNYPAASIGPVTTQTAVSLGFSVVIEAPQSTIASLVSTITNYFDQADPRP